MALDNLGSHIAARRQLRGINSTHLYRFLAENPRARSSKAKTICDIVTN